jgi:hypothetical protein
MKRLVILTVFVLTLGLMLAPGAMALPSYSGSLSSADGKIITSGNWDDVGFSIGWYIEQQGDGSWLYEYTLGTPNVPPDALVPAVSHFILEVSPNVTVNDFWGFDGPIELRLPGDDPFPDADLLNSALKLDFGLNEGELIYSFYSWRAPRLSDFVAKGGRAQSDVFAYAYNSGYGASIEGYELGDYFELGKILAPDTMTVIPEPGTMLLFGLGLVGAGVVRRYRNRA